MARNNPLPHFKCEMNPIDNSKYPKYTIHMKEGPIRHDIKFISYNDTIYLSAGKSENGWDVYHKAKQMGKYIYFEDMDPRGNSDNVIAMGVIGGIVGGIIGAGIMVPIVILSYDERSLYYDTEANALKELTDFEIFQLTTTGSPEIFKAYRLSERKSKDKEEVIRQLNEKYANLQSQE
jgi:hypothetical protein